MAVTIGLINLFALNWLHFNDYFVGLFLNAASTLSSLCAGKFVALSKSASINEALQSVLTHSVDAGFKIMSQGGYKNWAPLFIGFFYMCGGTVIVSVAMIELTLIKFVLSVLLSTGPLFIALYLFEQTQSFYKSWIATMSSFSFALIYSGLAVGVAMKCMDWVVGDVPEELRFYTLVPLILVCLFSLFLFFLVIPMAKSIGGVAGSAQTGNLMSAGQSLAATASQGAKGMSQRYGQLKQKGVSL